MGQPWGTLRTLAQDREKWRDFVAALVAHGKKGINSEANARRVHNVEQCFGSSGQPLGIPGRVLVGEGVLTKVCRKRAKPRQFFLFNDALVYGNIILHKKKYNKQQILPLGDVKLENVNDDGNLRNGWKIINPKKSFVVYAATATEKKEWMAHIRKCVDDLLLQRGITKSCSADSPVWVPDNEAKNCMHCSKSEFSMHHCRSCGIVACNSCTSKRWLLPEQSPKPIRVCLTCYQKLSSQASQNHVTRKYSVNKTGDDRQASSGDDSSDDEDEGAPARQNGSNTEAEELAIHDAHFQSYD
ncbi:pleckstrin homology domain-containing family F member 2 [Elysia marginata]|uniref:Pleckstrin homology domain-containing family F member 2 n=1 Tax=Elysia marginata TaxID=1093978 RepID=A0AAV4EYS6_9GAST|nr:pleckstrin homology domain-containing family F member 2 [Elysia marginata]